MAFPGGNPSENFSIFNNIYRFPKREFQSKYVSFGFFLSGGNHHYSRGYPVEVHTVTTDDGYILEVHRIPHGKGQPADSSVPYGKPIFLQHGFSTSDADWLISPSDRSLGKVNFLAHISYTAAIKGNLLIQTFYYYFLQHFAWQI